MATDAKPASPARTRPPVIRIAPGQANISSSWVHILPAWIISAVAHAVILVLFILFSFIGLSSATPPADITLDTQTVVEDQPENKDLTNPDIGINPEVPLNYN